MHAFGGLTSPRSSNEMILSCRSGKGSVGSSSLILLSVRSTNAVRIGNVQCEYKVMGYYSEVNKSGAIIMIISFPTFSWISASGLRKEFIYNYEGF